MSKKTAKPSEGPWAQEATSSSDFRFIRRINDANGRVIAEIRYAEGADQDENLANATLIQEAPALWEALRKTEAILAQLQEAPDKAKDIIRQDHFGHALARSRAVLAKMPD